MKLTKVARKARAALYKKARTVRCVGKLEVTKEDMEFQDGQELRFAHRDSEGRMKK